MHYNFTSKLDGSIIYINIQCPNKLYILPVAVRNLCTSLQRTIASHKTHPAANELTFTCQNYIIDGSPASPINQNTSFFYQAYMPQYHSSPRSAAVSNRSPCIHTICGSGEALVQGQPSMAPHPWQEGPTTTTAMSFSPSLASPGHHHQ